MITIISGTNRRNSKCLKFALQYQEFIEGATDEPVNLISLEDIPQDWLHIDMYDATAQSDSIVLLQNEFILPATKLFFVIPEYNGSFPGILKLFIDAISVRDYAGNFKNKKAGIAGVASGRAGNLRGMDHLVGVLHHVGMHVMPSQIPYSAIATIMEREEIVDPATLNIMQQHAEEFVNY